MKRQYDAKETFDEVKYLYDREIPLSEVKNYLPYAYSTVAKIYQYLRTGDEKHLAPSLRSDYKGRKPRMTKNKPKPIKPIFVDNDPLLDFVPVIFKTRYIKEEYKNTRLFENRYWSIKYTDNNIYKVTNKHTLENTYHEYDDDVSFREILHKTIGKFMTQIERNHYRNTGTYLTD